MKQKAEEKSGKERKEGEKQGGREGREAEGTVTGQGLSREEFGKSQLEPQAADFVVSLSIYPLTLCSCHGISLVPDHLTYF